MKYFQVLNKNYLYYVNNNMYATLRHTLDISNPKSYPITYQIKKVEKIFQIFDVNMFMIWGWLVVIGKTELVLNPIIFLNSISYQLHGFTWGLNITFDIITS